MASEVTTATVLKSKIFRCNSLTPKDDFDEVRSVSYYVLRKCTNICLFLGLVLYRIQIGIPVTIRACATKIWNSTY